ncbi:MAG TPA: ADP-ribosylglycohydrolase family protein [Solirubrobacterales bacterium]|jgi:ADP-ribosylglycohydrolase|nr:ADP-ribosylglycohydrolase family protein [Solirubrobacterales bacterium]
MERIRAGIIAFAAADAFGAPWEGAPPERLREVDLASVPRRDDWPRGATSDDTAQLILTARVLCSGQRDLRRSFMELLAAEFTQMRGAGPTTTAAVRRWQESGALGAADGATNGAAMRALPIGWGTPSADAEARRVEVLSIARATHGAPGALVAAGTVAAMGSWALDRARTEVICERAVAEAAVLASGLDAEVDLAAFEAAAQGGWTPPAAGISLDAIETVTAVLYVLQSAAGLADAIETAVRLGGDTDTVAAIVAGVLAAQGSDPARELPWLGLVQLPDASLIEELASGLAEKRG